MNTGKIIKKYICTNCGLRCVAEERSDEYFHKRCSTCITDKNNNDSGRVEYSPNWHGYRAKKNLYIAITNHPQDVVHNDDKNVTSQNHLKDEGSETEPMTYACGVCNNRIPVTQDGKLMAHDIYGGLLDIMPNQLCPGGIRPLEFKSAKDTHVVGTDIHERMEKEKMLLHSLKNDLLASLSESKTTLKPKNKLHKKIQANIAEVAKTIESRSLTEQPEYKIYYDSNGNSIDDYYYDSDDCINTKMKMNIAPTRDGIISIW